MCSDFAVLRTQSQKFDLGKRYIKKKKKFYQVAWKQVRENLRESVRGINWLLIQFTYCVPYFLLIMFPQSFSDYNSVNSDQGRGEPSPDGAN